MISKAIIFERKWDTKFFTKNLMLLLSKSLRQLASKVKLQKSLRKAFYIKNEIVKAEHHGFIKVQALNKNAIQTKSFHNQLVKRSKTALDEKSG